jgi:nifR3 family TIM-barrel protein
MRAETEIPVSVKLRSGWDPSALSYIACAEEALRAGASLLTLHPRTRSQGFGGKARWEEIAALKKASGVPVFGSGDLFTPEDCAAMIASTGCDGVMIARGALGNPFIFRQTAALLLEGTPPVPPTAGDRLGTALRHLALLVRFKGEGTACREMRKHFVAYTRGLPDCAALRQRLVRAAAVEEYETVVGEYLAGHAGA